MASALLLALLGLAISRVQCVRIGSTGLELTALGYNYQGLPLTGAVFETFRNGKLARIMVLWNGERHGPEIQWHENGQRSIERHYRHGHEYGVHRAWYPDGSVRSLKTFSDDGQAEGDFFEWHSNGQLSTFVRYDHGREIAAKSWTAGGKPFYNYRWREDLHVGLEGDRFCSPSKNE